MPLSTSRPSSLLAARRDPEFGTTFASMGTAAFVDVSRFRDGAAAIAQQLAPSDLGLAGESLSFEYGRFHGASDGASHLFLTARAGIAVDLVEDAFGGLALANVVVDARATGDTFWPAFAGALRASPSTEALELVSGGTQIRRYDLSNPDPTWAEEVGDGTAPDICRLSDGTLAAAWVSPGGTSERPGELAIQFARLPDDLSQAPVLLAPFFPDPDVGGYPGVLLLACSDTSVTFVLVPAPGIGGAQCYWHLYQWDGSSARHEVVAPPASSDLYCQVDHGTYTVAAWAESCEGARLLVPWLRESGTIELEYFEY